MMVRSEFIDQRDFIDRDTINSNDVLQQLPYEDNIQSAKKNNG